MVCKGSQMVNNTDGADSCGSTKSLFGRTGGPEQKRCVKKVAGRGNE